MKRLAVINVVGLNRSLIGEWSPHIAKFARAGIVRTLNPVLPAVTCSVQSSMLTGVAPSQHGVVGNGWYNRELAEVQFWKQSNHVVQCPKIWDELKRLDPSFTSPASVRPTGERLQSTTCRSMWMKARSSV